MAPFIQYAALCAVPAAAFYGLARLLGWYTTWDRARDDDEPVPGGPAITTLCRDLTRLQRDYQTLLRSDAPAKAARLRAVGLAYDDTLCACCAALEVEDPGRPPLDGAVRLEVEAALAQRGLNW